MLTSLLLLPILHYIADFELQSDWMALNKSKDWKVLTWHVGIYAICFTVIFGWQFGLITFVTHWLTDWGTSRLNASNWFIDLYPRPDDQRDSFGSLTQYGAYEYYAHIEMGKRHRFFCGIGLDQMIHAYCLGLTAYYFGLS